MASAKKAMPDRPPLSPAALKILVALASGEKHGYAIMREISESTGGHGIGPGTLYRTLGKLLDDGLIEESNEPSDSEPSEERRRYYRLCDIGRNAAIKELREVEQLVVRAREAKLLPGFGLNPVPQGV